MSFTTDDVKALRDSTGVSIMQCKKALEEAGGNIEQALVILRKRAGATADKKGDRTLGAGTVASYIHDNSVGAMVLLMCETDFVAKNEEFIALARTIAMQVAATKPQYVSVDHVPEEARMNARAVFLKEVEGKPENMKEQILEGKLASFFKDSVLVEQSFIRDESRTINDLIKDAIQKFGERIEITEISRLSARP